MRPNEIERRSRGRPSSVWEAGSFGWQQRVDEGGAELKKLLAELLVVR